MTQKLNCWEFKNCGREPGGALADQMGICPTALEMKRDGDNGGRAAGRVCWTVPLDNDGEQSLKCCTDKACLSCHFYKRVQFEEQFDKEIQNHLTIAGKQANPTQTAREPLEAVETLTEKG